MSDQELIERLEAHVRAHLEACNDAMDELCVGSGPALAPYCGCSDCDLRETLYATSVFMARHRGARAAMVRWAGEAPVTLIPGQMTIDDVPLAG